MSLGEKPFREAVTQGRLLARPTQPTETAALGLQPLGLSGERDGLLYIPAGYRVDRPAPLVLMLHGAGNNASNGVIPFRHLADAKGLILLAPASRQRTWDVIRSGYGPDVAFIDQALAQTFSRYAIDPTHIACEGFSDGASYALGLGITNGDLFTHVIAFSPGFMSPAAQRGKPRLFISHGKWDTVKVFKPLWLAWVGEEMPPLSEVWRLYLRRFAVDHWYRFIKQRLHWTLPKLSYNWSLD